MDVCVCLDAMFAPTPSLHSLEVAAAAGIRSFEFWDWRSWDVPALGRLATRLQMTPVAFSGNTFEEPLVDAGAHPRTLHHIGRSLEVAGTLGVPVLTAHVGHSLAGRERAHDLDLDLDAQWEAAVAGLRAAGDLAGRSGVTLAVEPLNSRIDHPGYFLDTLDMAQRLLAEVDHPAVRLLLDVYHMWVMHDDLPERLSAVAPMVAHVHAADVPGRGEPGSGIIPWPAILERLRGGGYRGVVGLECWPTGRVEAALRRSIQVLAA